MTHESHKTRCSDSSFYDEICTLCGATDAGKWLSLPCPDAAPVPKPPTAEEAYEECVQVESHADPSWRHGCYMTEVYHRLDDNTFWKCVYRRSADGETDELREGYCVPEQVWPIEEMVLTKRWVTRSRRTDDAAQPPSGSTPSQTGSPAPGQAGSPSSDDPSA